MSESQTHTYLKNHTLSGDALLFDLNEQAASVLKEASGQGSHAARTLIKDGPMRVTMVAFQDGGALRQHKAPGPVSIQVLQGEIEIGVGSSAEQLIAGHCLVLGANVEHSVVAHKQSVILLTIAMT